MGVVIPAVDLVEIDIIGSEAAEAVIDGMHDVLARKPALVGIVAHRVEHLGGDDHAVARGSEILERAPQNFLAHAQRIHVGGIEKVDSQFQRALDKRPALRLLQNPLAPLLRAVGHRAQADARHLEPCRSKSGILHSLSITPANRDSGYTALVKPIFLGLALLLAAGAQPVRTPQQQYRSTIVIFDRADGTSRALYTADTIFEAPNWSHDGKYLLVNSGGNLMRLPVEGASPAPEKIDLGAAYRCNNDHGFTREGRMLAFSATLASGAGFSGISGHGRGERRAANDSGGDGQLFPRLVAGLEVAGLRGPAQRCIRTVPGGRRRRSRTAPDLAWRIRRWTRLFPGRQVDLLQFQPVGRLGHLAHSPRWRSYTPPNSTGGGRWDRNCSSASRSCGGWCGSPASTRNSTPCR